jgi:hypothetical protein
MREYHICSRNFNPANQSGDSSQDIPLCIHHRPCLKGGCDVQADMYGLCAADLRGST